MADTVVRVYNLRPDDIQVRRSGIDLDGNNVALYLGDLVSLEGDPVQLRALLGIAQLRIEGLAATMPERQPF